VGVLCGLETHPLWGQQHTPEEFFALIVGNSWTYTHLYNDLFGEVGPQPEFIEKEITLSITHTEEIDTFTYFVLSEMPYDWPPAPDFFLAGRKIRLNQQGILVERREDKEYSLFNLHFVTDPEDTTWSSGSVRLVGGGKKADELFWGQFIDFFSHEMGQSDIFAVGDESARYRVNVKQAAFRQFYGPEFFSFNVWAPTDFNISHSNELIPKYALLNGERIDFSDVGGVDPRLTSVKANSWGQLKKSIRRPEDN